MKTTIITIMLFITVAVSAQQNVRAMKNINDTDTSRGKWYSSRDFSEPSKNIDDTKPIAFVSYRKDTLYLVNEGIGLTIAKSWEGALYIPERDGRKPKIVFTTQKYIVARHESKVSQKFIVND